MFVALTIFLIVLTVSIHELCHAYVMQKHGIAIKEMSLGLWPSKLSFFTFSHPKFFGGAPVHFTPLLLGAFVRSTEDGDKKLENLPYKEKSQIYAAGIIGNLIFGFALIVIFKIMKGSFDMTTILSGMLVLFLTVTMVRDNMRTAISLYLIPLIGALTTVLLVFTIADSPTQSVVGPIGMPGLIADHSKNIWQAIAMGSIMSFSLAMMNALPLLPLDGGHIIKAILDSSRFKRTAKLFQGASFTIFIIFMIFVLAVDICKL